MSKGTDITKDYLTKKHGKSMMELNKDMLLTVDTLVGTKSYYILELIGEGLYGSHPSLVCSYLMFTQSWPIPEELKDKLEFYMNETIK